MNELEYRQRIYSQYVSRGGMTVPIPDEKNLKRWGHAFHHYMRGWLPGSPAAPILEVACGSGRFLKLLDQLGYTHLQGVDLSPEQVDLSRRILPNHQVQLGDAIGFLEAHPDHFALIVGLDIAEHFTKVECLQFLDACHRALQPCGRLILQTPNLDSPFAVGIRYGDFTHELGLCPNSMRWLLQLSGFARIEIRETGPVIHGLASLARWIIWRVLRCIVTLWNVVETGSRGADIHTRTMMVSAIRSTE